jgi:hypothetical protein
MEASRPLYPLETYYYSEIRLLEKFVRLETCTKATYNRSGL